MELFVGKEFPDTFPDGCPPEIAKGVRIKVYRLIKGEKPSSDDFKSYKELGIEITSKKYPFTEYGLSVNTNFEDLEKVLLGSMKVRRRFKNIATGYTYICTGVVQDTPRSTNQSHVTWWIYKDASPENFFKVVKR